MLFVAAAGSGVWAQNPRPEPDLLVQNWLLAQTNFHSWTAEFVQTRSFKTLVQPLSATGQVYFASPNRFRWEVKTLPPTIAVRAPKELLVIYPKLKRVERYPLTGNDAGPWRDALSLLEAGFPRDRAQLEAQYIILAENVSNNTCEVTMQPKSAAARKMMPQIKIAFDTGTFLLRATELAFADGSTMRNDFASQVLNPPIAERLFDPEFPSDYKIVEPLKKKH